jgi:ParB-like chromosome segregation protein Spo0J
VDIAVWLIARIKPYDQNPRINDAAVDAVAASIKEFGFRQPIVVDEEGVIIVGHTRYKAALKLGITEVPVHVARGLTPAQAKAYRIADNQTAALSQFDENLLSVELAELQALDFDLNLTGFSADELLRLLQSESTDGQTDPDDVPEPPDEATTRPGDLWLLGKHRLLCGDSSKPEDVDRLLDGAEIHLVNTDPPYNVKVEPRSNNAIAAGLSSFQGPKHHQSLDLARHPEKSKPTGKKLRAKDRPLENDFVSDEEFNRLLYAWFGNLARVLEPGRGFYIWGGYANLGNYPPSAQGMRVVFLPGNRLEQASSGSHEKGLHGVLRAGVLWLERGRGPQVLRPQQRPRLVGCEKNQSSKHVSPDRKAGCARRPCVGVLVAARREHLGSVRR